MIDKANSNVEISKEEYEELVESKIRIKLFADYVNKQRYSIGREECGAFLGIEVKEDGIPD